MRSRSPKTRLIALAMGGVLASIAAETRAETASPDNHRGMAIAQADQSGKRSPAPVDAYCYIGWPNDGEVLRQSRFKVWFGTRNFGVAPAGISKANTGHHHLIIDAPLPPLGEPIPNDAHHPHFGAGQTEAFIELPPGKHTLQLLMGDADHVPHDPPVMSKRITIEVRPAAVAGAR